MSTCRSVILTKDNEHWYFDYMDGCYHLEFAIKHFEIADEEYAHLKIEPGSPMYNFIDVLSKLNFKNIEGIE